MTTLQKALIGATLAAAVGTGVYEARRASALQEQRLTLRQQPAQPAGDIKEASRQVAALEARNETLRREAAEVARLRGEVARLREKTAPSNNDPTTAEVRSWLARVNQLKAQLEQTPEAKIPEFQFLTERDWLKAAKGDLNTDSDYRGALSDLRDYAESRFISAALQPALKLYAQANNGQFPSDINQLQPYFDPPVDNAILQRWEVAPMSTVPSVGVGDTVITQIAAVDAEHDNRFAIGPNGSGSAGPQDWDPSSNPGVILKPAMQAYAAANNGQQPADPSQLAPYATTPEQQAALQRVMQQRAAK